jgi:uncharacterized protein YyaL (SSP411 family)
MISAFAQAGAAFNDARYREAAVRAAEFVLKHMRSTEGRLFRSFGVGHAAKLNAYLEDYAFLADAFVSLYEATFEPRWLREAASLAEFMVKNFSDPSGPGFFFVSADHEKLIARTKDLHDGSTPSGNSVAVTVLLRLAKLLDRRDYAVKAEETLKGYHSTMAEHPAASGQMLIALDFHLGPTVEVAVVGNKGSVDTGRALGSIQRAFRPNKVLAFHEAGAGTESEFVPLLKEKVAVNNKVTAYVCQNYACRAPLIGVDAIRGAFETPWKA